MSTGEGEQTRRPIRGKKPEKRWVEDLTTKIFNQDLGENKET